MQSRPPTEAAPSAHMSDVRKWGGAWLEEIWDRVGRMRDILARASAAALPAQTGVGIRATTVGTARLQLNWMPTARQTLGGQAPGETVGLRTGPITREYSQFLVSVKAVDGTAGPESLITS